MKRFLSSLCASVCLLVATLFFFLGARRNFARVAVAMLLASLFVPLEVLAQVVVDSGPPVPAPSLAGFTFEQVLGFLAPIIVLALGIAFRIFFKEKAADRQADVTWAIRTAYHFVDEVARRTESPAIDKAAAALKKFTELLENDGKAPTARELKEAEARFVAMHGLEKKELALAAAGARALPQ